ncbi:MAG: glycosyltransferase, partial [Gammaproteobacteria bacterium]|nr:glycosyltransferase [Gammaproteobacteria bacterium]
AVLSEVRARDQSVRVINTAPSYVAMLFGSRLWGGFKAFHSGACMLSLLVHLARNSNVVVYRPINGGYGQVYDLFYISICRLFQTKIFIHHHSFNYLNEFSGLFFILEKIIGASGVHVVLGARMGELLSIKYGVNPAKIRTVSNAAFFKSGDCTVKSEDSAMNVGHLANLCSAKGLDVFVDVCRELKELNVPFRARIAGPFADECAEHIVRSACEQMEEIQYLGAIYGEEKESFYRSLDAFVFPSRYKNEAEPLVLFEAARNGALVYGTRRGCMGDVIESLRGYSYLESSDLAKVIAADIRNSSLNGEFTKAFREERIAELSKVLLCSKKSIKNLLSEMGSHNVSEIG